MIDSFDIVDEEKNQSSVTTIVRNFESFFDDPPDSLKDTHIPSESVVTKAINEANLHNRTLYNELFIHCKEYGIRVPDLIRWIRYCYQPIYVLPKIDSLMYDRETADVLGGVNSCVQRGVIPLMSKDGYIKFMLTDRVDDDMLRNKIETLLSPMPVLFTVCTPAEWASVMSRMVGPELIVSQAMQMKPQESQYDQRSAKDSEAKQLYKSILNAGKTSRASDIHFIPQDNDCIILFRVDGIEEPYATIPKAASERIYNILCNDGGVQLGKMKPNTPISAKVRFKLSEEVGGHEIDLRVSVIPSIWGKDINIRYLSSNIRSMEEIGISSQHISTYKELLDAPHGMVIQVGPTGSGKSTTLYSGLQYQHQSWKNIITMEDPVEVIMPGITQVDVRRDTELDYAEALKACMRHDPDVLVVGEIRDPATASDAVEAANTGHLVLTSLHTNDSIGVIERMITLGVEPASLGEVLLAVMSQRLVRRLCPYCKKKIRVNGRDPKYSKYNLDSNKTYEVFEPTGCEYCDGRGYRDRIAVNEILMVDKGMRDLIQTHAVRGQIEDYLLSVGFKSMLDDSVDKVLQGITSFSEVEKFAKDTLSFSGSKHSKGETT